MTANDFSETVAALQAKHPRPHTGSSVVQSHAGSDIVAELSVLLHAVAYAVHSFPCGLAGEPDGLTPPNLKDMIGAPAGEGGPVLLSALSCFVHFVLRGEVLKEVCSLFWGANLIPFSKTDGGVQPIAVGCMLRILVAKFAGSS